MNSSTRSRQVPGPLLRCMIVASCFLLASCDGLSSLFCPKQESHYPSTVLLINKKDVNEANKTGHYVFDWTKITIGNEPLTNVLGTPKYWRITVYSSEDPRETIVGVDPKDPTYGFIDYSKSKTKEFDLPLDYLMRADIDLILDGTPKDIKNATSIPFVVLLHKFPENG